MAVGTLKGKVRFYSVDDAGRLEYEAQIGGRISFLWSCAYNGRGARSALVAWTPLGG